MSIAFELQGGRLLVGSPATAREQLGAYLEQSYANYFIGRFASGRLPIEHVLSSVDLFANEDSVSVDWRRCLTMP
jgi:alkanesulfonate monooxygenase SsuD/methylene tetrahydromethanopterin reductase-like flavin-dependent oxidoreductase (luciferase family)